MEPFVLKLNPFKLTFKQKAAVAVLASFAYFIVDFSWTHLWPTPWEKQSGVGAMALKAGGIALFWGIAMSFLVGRIYGRANYTFLNYTLQIEDESITGVSEYPRFKWWTTRKSVRKGKICTISEIKGRFGWPSGIRLSERTGFGMWITGWVYVPSSLPNYEDLKRVLGSWRIPEEANQ